MDEYSSKIALLGNSIDYAGQFPPASLPFKEAVSSALHFKEKAIHPWLFSKMVIAFKDLSSIEPKLLFELGSNGTKLELSTLETSSSILDIERDLRAIRSFNMRYQHTSHVILVTHYESKYFMQKKECDSAPFLQYPDIHYWFEIDLKDDWRTLLPKLREWDRKMKMGVKVRFVKETLPDVSELSQFLRGVSQSKLKFKATQGLHHPFSTDKEYGFINLFFSLLLSQKENPEIVKNCLMAKSGFVFSKEKLSWDKYAFTCSEIEEARKDLAYCFGSCSLSEPDQFLKEIL